MLLYMVRICLGLSLLFSLPTLLLAEAPSSPAPVPVEVTKVTQKDIIHGTVSIGELKASHSVLIKSEIDGKIARLNLPEGKCVQAGDLLVELDDTIAKATLDQKLAKKHNSELHFQRQDSLIKKGTGAQSARDDAAAQLRADEADVEQAQAHLAKTQIRAPFAGSLGLRKVEVGDYVEPGTSLIPLDDTKNLLVDFSVPEKHLTELKVDQEVQLSTDALPGQKFTGKIIALAPQVDNSLHTLQARAIVPNTEELLRPGLFVKVQVVFVKKRDALIVPEQAVFMIRNQNYVYRIVDNKAVRTPVTTGVRENSWVEVVKGLSPTDRVARSGRMRLFDGAPVMEVKT